jgi:hypothetical protein
MTKRKAKQWIKGCNELIEGYEQREFLFPCPLCVVAEKHTATPTSPCPNCLWILFEKREHCLPFKEKRLSTRIKRLNRWKIKLQEIIDE